MKLKNKQQQIKKRIVVATLHAINKQGLPSVQLNKIASSMGLSLEEVQCYFKNESKLFEHLLHNHLERIKEEAIKEETFSSLLSSLNEKKRIDQEEILYLSLLSEAFLPYIESVEVKEEYKEFYYQLHCFYEKKIEKDIKKNDLTKELDSHTLAKNLILILDVSVINQKKFQREKITEDKIIVLVYSILEKNLRVSYEKLTYLIREKFEKFSSYYQCIKEKKRAKHLLDLSSF
jgi:AcrR family transcriptional regulator